MSKRIIAALVLVLTLHSPAQAVWGVGDTVFDPTAYAELVAIVAKLVILIEKASDHIKISEGMLEDMAFQAIVGDVPWNEDTEELLREMRRYGRGGDGLLYGGDIDGKWWEIFGGTSTYANGGWLPAMEARGYDALVTQQKLLHLIKMRDEAFEDDHRRMQALQDMVDTSYSRNQLIKAQSAMAAEIARQDQTNQQINMTIANAQIVANAHRDNEQLSREAQERAFMTNFDKEPERPVFVDRGL